MASLSEIVPAGVVTGDDLINLMKHARENGYAIPAVNCTRYDTIDSFESSRLLTTIPQFLHSQCRHGSRS